MKSPSELARVIEQIGAHVHGHDPQGFAISWTLPGKQYGFVAIVSWGEGWDHVSVRVAGYLEAHGCIPTWDEMTYIKSLFFRPEETALQYHPPESMYVNHHPHVLHLWRPQAANIPMPPLELV